MAANVQLYLTARGQALPRMGGPLAGFGLVVKGSGTEVGIPNLSRKPPRSPPIARVSPEPGRSPLTGTVAAPEAIGVAF